MRTLPSVLLAGSLLLGTPILAQSPATTPAAAASKAKLVSGSDKTVVKEIMDRLYLVHTLVTAASRRRKDEPTLLPDEGWKAMTAAAKLNNGLYGEAALLIPTAELPTAVSPKDRKRMEILSPAKPGNPKAPRGRKDDKKLEYPAAWCLLMSEELTELGKVLDKAAKSTDPQMSKLSATWSGPAKDIVTALAPMVPAKSP
jgi:hypothetical protein